MTGPDVIAAKLMTGKPLKILEAIKVVACGVQSRLMLVKLYSQLEVDPLHDDLAVIGITEKTVIPFGFRDSDFYDQMLYATGIMHVFMYNFIDDVVDYFAQLLTEALK